MKIKRFFDCAQNDGERITYSLRLMTYIRCANDDIQRLALITYICVANDYIPPSADCGSVFNISATQTNGLHITCRKANITFSQENISRKQSFHITPVMGIPLRLPRLTARNDGIANSKLNAMTGKVPTARADYIHSLCE